MANVVESRVDVHLRPVAHSSTPLSYNYSYSSSLMNTTAAPSHFQPPTAFQPITNTLATSAPARPSKRRLEYDDTQQDGSRYRREEHMDRSPTPERPKRAPPKRARVFGSNLPSKGDGTGKGSSDGTADVDIGVLLASLPPHSLLSILDTLVTANPSLKSTVLSLIPRPTLETAIQALNVSAKKLIDAYPYSSNSGALPFSTGFGFSNSSFPNRSGSFVSSTIGFGFGSGSSSMPVQTQSSGNGGMRDSYITSRLRPHVSEFISASTTYLPYFSYISSNNDNSSSQASSSNVLHALHKDKFHPNETYAFLACLTRHLLEQPPLTRSLLTPDLLPRLKQEWEAWVDRVNVVVNKEGGMFGGETVNLWIRELDSFAETKDEECAPTMQSIRDLWITKVGWLVGRRILPSHAMEADS